MSDIDDKDDVGPSKKLSKFDQPSSSASYGIVDEDIVMELVEDVKKSPEKPKKSREKVGKSSNSSEKSNEKSDSKRKRENDLYHDYDGDSRKQAKYYSFIGTDVSIICHFSKSLFFFFFFVFDRKL